MTLAQLQDKAHWAVGLILISTPLYGIAYAYATCKASTQLYFYAKLCNIKTATVSVLAGLWKGGRP